MIGDLPEVLTLSVVSQTQPVHRWLAASSPHLLQLKSPKLVCSMEVDIDLTLELVLETFINVVQVIWNDLVINLHGVKFLCWMDERYFRMW